MDCVKRNDLIKAREWAHWAMQQELGEDVLAATHVILSIPVPKPRAEDILPGEPWIVTHDGHEWVGQRAWGDEKVPWIVTRVVPGGDVDFEYCHDDEVVPVSMLVPEGDV